MLTASALNRMGFACAFSDALPFPTLLDVLQFSSDTLEPGIVLPAHKSTHNTSVIPAPAEQSPADTSWASPNSLNSDTLPGGCIRPHRLGLSPTRLLPPTCASDLLAMWGSHSPFLGFTYLARTYPSLLYRVSQRVWVCW